MEDPGKNPDPPGAAWRIPGSAARYADLPSQNKKTPIPNRNPLHYDAAGSGNSNILEQCSINSIPKKLSSITPYIPNSRPKPKPPKKNVITISQRLTAVNDSIDWPVLFIARLLVMVQQGTACRYLAVILRY